MAPVVPCSIFFIFSTISHVVTELYSRLHIYTTPAAADPCNLNPHGLSRLDHLVGLVECPCVATGYITNLDKETFVELSLSYIMYVICRLWVCSTKYYLVQTQPFCSWALLVQARKNHPENHVCISGSSLAFQKVNNNNNEICIQPLIFAQATLISIILWRFIGSTNMYIETLIKTSL